MACIAGFILDVDSSPELELELDQHSQTSLFYQLELKLFPYNRGTVSYSLSTAQGLHSSSDLHYSLGFRVFRSGLPSLLKGVLRDYLDVVPTTPMPDYKLTLPSTKHPLDYIMTSKCDKEYSSSIRPSNDSSTLSRLGPRRRLEHQVTG